MSRLEHVNLTVADARATADLFSDLFGWAIRWQGDSADGSKDAIHVGGPDSYVALFARKDGQHAANHVHDFDRIGLNHLGVVVDDLDAVRDRVTARGLTAGEEQDYEPGRRFYFFEENGIEIEVVSYA